MKEETKEVNIKDNNGKLINNVKLKIIRYNDPSDIKKLNKIYKKWKSLCKAIRSLSRRSINIPETISEITVAYLYNFYFLNKNSIYVKKQKISTSFDCFDPIKGDKIQVKACSAEKDLTTFGPRSVYDRLIFVDYYNDGKFDGIFTIYEIPKNIIQQAYVNATQSITQQAGQGKRPRICIKTIIQANNIIGTRYQLTSKIKKL